MTYNKTNWVDGVTPVSAQNMNNLETQYEKAKADLDTHKADNTQHGIAWKKIDEIILGVDTAQVDITLSDDYDEFKIIGKNIKSHTGTNKALYIKPDNVIGAYTTYSYNNLTESSLTYSNISLGKTPLGNITPCFLDLEINRIAERGYVKFNVYTDGTSTGGFGKSTIKTNSRINTLSFKSDLGTNLAIDSKFEIWGR